MRVCSFSTCSFVSILAFGTSALAQVDAVDSVEVKEEIRRAIPVDAPPTAQVLSPEIARLPDSLPESAKAYYTRCEVPQSVIALTFDDGPHPELTPRLLDILKERNVKVTFFVVGRSVATYPAIVKRMVAEGHEVANHTWSHPSLTTLGTASAHSQLRRAHDAIVKACGVEPVLYRPPYGALGLSQRKHIHSTFGYSAILWDVDPLDWQSPRSVQKVHDRVLAGAKPGSIVLCHDIHQTTVDAIPAILDAWIARGYQMVTVSQLINLESQTLLAKAAEAASQTAESEISLPVVSEKSTTLIESQP